jgi:2-methylcitrate dehydratase PrpD
MRFFRPASIGGFGATAAAANLRGFDESATARAMGIMYGQTSGGMQTHVDGASMLGLQIGFAARNALFACDLAAAGVDGPKNIVTGPWGYLPLYENIHEVDASWHSWGKIWRLTELAHKPFPTGRPTHYAIAALLDLRAAHGFTADDVAEVICRVPPVPRSVVGRPDRRDATANYAKLCLPFICATTLRHGTVGPQDFSAAALADADTHALAARIKVEEGPGADPTAFGPQTVTVTLKSGQRHACTVDFALGDPRNPLSRARQLEKFWWAWEIGTKGAPRSKGEQVIELLDHLEDLRDATALIACLIP